MLDSRINVVKPRSDRFWVSSCRQVSSGVYFRQVLAIADMIYTALLIKLSQGSFAPTIGYCVLSLVATYDIKELMCRDWATLKRRGTFL